MFGPTYCFKPRGSNQARERRTRCTEKSSFSFVSIELRTTCSIFCAFVSTECKTPWSCYKTCLELIIPKLQAQLEQLIYFFFVLPAQLQSYMEEEISRNLVSIYNNEFSRRFMDLLQIHVSPLNSLNSTERFLPSDAARVNAEEFSIEFDCFRRFQMECCGAVDKVDYKRNHLTIPQSCSNYRTNNIHIYVSELK